METAGWASTNIARLLKFICEAEKKRPPDHVIILGDLTTRGLTEEFELAKATLVDFQNRLLATRDLEVPDGELSPDIYTVIPGNHDLTTLTRSFGGSVIDSLHGCWWRAVSKLSRPKGNTRRMSNCLKEFDRHFGETIRDGHWQPSRRSQEFGSYSKLLTGTNIQLLPLNTCLPLPVTALGWNARGRLDSSQLQALASHSADDGVLGSVEPFRIALMHHFPMALPIGDDTLRTFQDIDGASHILNLAYRGSQVAMILSGHRHADFIWKNSTSVPGITRCMPVVSVGTRTHEDPDTHNLQFCVIQLESRDLSSCDFEHTLVTIEYYVWAPAVGCRRESQEELCIDPSCYKELRARGSRAVRDMRCQKGATIESLIDLSGSLAIDAVEQGIVESVDMDDDQACLEASRFGLIVHKIGRVPTDLVFHLDKAPYGGSMSETKEVSLSHSAVAGQPQVRINRGPKRQWSAVTTDVGVCSTPVDDLAKDCDIRISLRSEKELGEVVLHCVCVSKI